MSIILNQAIFSKNANDDSAIREVTVVRVSNGDIGLRLKASDADSNKKVFDTFEAWNSGARHGQNPVTQDHFCLFDTKSIEIIATILVKLKDKQLLSKEFFINICANFPSEIENIVDRRVADIVGAEPSQRAIDPFNREVGKKALAYQMLGELLQSPECAGINPAKVITTEFDHELDLELERQADDSISASNRIMKK